MAYKALALASVVVVVGSMVAACSDDTSAAPQVYLSTFLGAGSDPENSSQICQIATAPWVDIGSGSASVPNGGNVNGAAVTVDCTVTANPNGFTVTANATLQGQGALTIQGNFTTSGDQQNIQAVFGRSDTGTFTQNDCVVSYASNGNMGIAPGRVWGTITCPRATDSRESPPRVCNATGEFKFENCRK